MMRLGGEMTEEPIKLFAKRSERIPQREDADDVGEAALELLKKVPLVGDTTAYILSLFFNPFEQRRDDWFKELADDLDDLSHTVQGCTAENLVKDPAFVSATIQATRIAIGTHNKEKRKYLRNALLNIAKGTTSDEIMQQLFLNAIEAFTPAHVKALNLIWRGAGLKIRWDENKIPMQGRNYGAAIGLLAAELTGQPALTGAVLADLRARGFSNLAGPDQVFPQGGIITNLGVAFLKFVLSPEDLP